jgi:hypothetical protein
VVARMSYRDAVQKRRKPRTLATAGVKYLSHPCAE